MAQEVNIGDSVIVIKFDIMALRAAQKKMGRPVRDVVQNMDVDEVCELTACGLLHNGSKVVPKTVEGWLQKNPECFLPLMTALAHAIAEAYARLLPQKKETEE